MQIQHKHVTVKIFHIALFWKGKLFFFVLDLVLEHEEREALELPKCHTFVFNKIVNFGGFEIFCFLIIPVKPRTHGLILPIKTLPRSNTITLFGGWIFSLPWVLHYQLIYSSCLFEIRIYGKIKENITENLLLSLLLQFSIPSVYASIISF